MAYLHEPSNARFSYFLAEWRMHAFVLAASLLVNGLGLALPLALIQVYDRILPNEAYGTVTALVAGVFVAILLETCLRVARHQLMAVLGARFELGAGRRAYERMIRCDLMAFEGVGSGEHLERFNALNTVRDFYSGQAMISLYDLPFAAIFLYAVFYLGGYVALVPAVLVVLAVLAAPRFGAVLSRAIRRHMRAENRRFDFLIGAIAGNFSVKALANESMLATRYESLQDVRADRKSAVDRRAAGMIEASATMTNICIGGVATLGAFAVLAGDLSVGGLAACTILAGRVMQPVQGAVGLWTRYQNFAISYQQFSRIFELPTPDYLEAGAQSDAERIDRIGGRIDLRGVCLEVPGTDTRVLSGIDLTVEENEMVGLVGPNGTGKSLILSIVRGLVQPTSGEVCIDGAPLSAFSPEVLRNKVMYLPQQEEMFHGTILDNITMFRRTLNSRALAAAKLLGITAEIGRLREGFQTRIGGTTSEHLPRGLAQRIAIARALVNRPRVLLFDEANIAIDHEGDEYLKSTLRRLKGVCTVVVVSHRPSILTIADRVVGLRDGGMIDDGEPGRNQDALEQISVAGVPA